MPDKAERQEAICGILRARPAVTQADIRSALRKRGLAVDQSTLSRDLAELGMKKLAGRYVADGNGHAAADDEVDYSAMVRSFSTCGPNLIVIRAATGQAQPVAVAIDKRSDSSIFATLAGDDAIFVATKTRRTQAVAIRRLTQWFGEKYER
jgi:transcriptional regulator of arginine metabolism